MPLDWDQVKHVFEWDGFVREAHVRHAGIEGWQSFLNALRRSDYGYSYSLDDDSAATLGNAQEAFDNYRDIGSNLSLTAEGVLILIHFFDPEHIECSIDPLEITGPEKLQVVCDWLHFLAKSTDLDATLTPEGYPEGTIIQVSPDGSTQYLAERSATRRKWYWPFGR